MDVRIVNGKAVCTLLESDYMADQAEGIRTVLKEFSERRRQQHAEFDKVIVDASCVSGYLAIEVAKTLWSFARFQGGMALACPHAHVTDHLRRFFPSVEFVQAVPDAADLRAAA